MNGRNKDLNKARRTFDPTLLARLDAFTNLLLKWNRSFSLTSIRDEEVFIKLVAPSAWLGLEYERERVGTVIDFGSGAGIPGIPMAMTNPSARYILVDSNQKKIGFIKNCISDRTLWEAPNASAMLVRLNPEGGGILPRADRVVARASGSMGRVLSHIIGCGARHYDFFKGREESKVEITELEEKYPQATVDIRQTPDWFDDLVILRVSL
ncbi:MAG: class I SAM-dependent methyltransferase [Nitrospinae bacterium]|nr:class I SAM-dependent methyltransferase [Nitrospinota bacterium]